MEEIVLHKVRFVVPAGRASANQTLSQLFAKLTINLVNFCEEFNEKTAGLDLEEEPILLSVNLVVFADKSFKYTIDKPSTSFLILLATNFIQEVKRNRGVIKLHDLVVIARFKFENYNLQSSCSSILGTAKSLGVILR